MADALSFASATPSALSLFINGGRNPRAYSLLSSSLSWLPSSSSSPLKSPLSCSCSYSTPTPAKMKSSRTPAFSDGRGEDQSRPVCPGCGVFMQDSDANLPGFFQRPSKPSSHDPLELDDELLQDDEEEEVVDDDELTFGSASKSNLDAELAEFEAFSDEDLLEEEEGTDWKSEWNLEEEEGEDEKWKKELDGFAPAGVGYGNITEETLGNLRKEKVSKAEKKCWAREVKKSQAEAEDAVIVCARCHSLRNYGHVKNQKAENLIPDFDFDRFVSSRLTKPSAGATVVVMVVDCVDFDGSFPKRAAKSLFKALESGKRDSKLSKSLKLVLVATKIDLLPSQISPTRLDRWVRNRAKSAGAPKINGVYLVSSRKDLGVRNLLTFIKELAGPRGNVWVIGAQNAGKSTLINAFVKKEGAKLVRLTEAAVPGTTLGILRITGILPAKAKMYDTPGLLHPYLMTMRLNREEQKMVEIRKELQPRTYRMKVGQTVHVGGLMRLDLTWASVETIYSTIWASPNVSLHMGKTENADEIRTNHIGIRLQPPIGQDKVSELAHWEAREIKVSGNSWELNSIDIAASGLGWFSLGLKGEATVILWTFAGIEVMQREALVLDRAPFLERPGFWLPKVVSDAIGNQSRMDRKAKKLKQETTDSLLEATL